MRRIALFCLLLLPSLSQAAYRCDPAAGPDAIEKGFGAEIERLGAAQKASDAAYQARLEGRADELVRSGAWSTEDRGRFYLDLLTDDVFASEEALKKERLAAFMARISAAAEAAGTDGPAACRNAEQAIGVFEEIIASSERQWRHMEAELAKVPRTGG